MRSTRSDPAGRFLAAPSTRKGFKNGYYPSPIFSRWSMEKWQAAGEPLASSILQEYTCDLIATATAPADCQSLLARGEEFIKGLK